MSDHAHPHSEDPWMFNLHMFDLKASNLATRHRFKEKLRCKVTIERGGSADVETKDKTWKTEWRQVGGDDLYWKMDQQFQLEVYFNRQAQDRVISWLKSHHVIIDCYCQHDSKKKAKKGGKSYGMAKVTLFDCVTGAVNHHLPLLNDKNESVGRIFFSLIAEQINLVALHFNKLGFSGLKSIEGDKVQGLNPYVKYQYSKYWPLVEKNKMKAVFSNIQHRTLNPDWEDLPVLRFRTGLKEMLGESVMVHCLHSDKKQATVARANLLFRTLVDSGKTFKEKDVITFNGALKLEGAKIHGELVLRNMPCFAQLKPVNVSVKPLHTEAGLYDGVQLLPWVVPPVLPMVDVNTTEAAHKRHGGKGKVAQHLDDSTLHDARPPAAQEEDATPSSGSLAPPVLSRGRSSSVGNAAHAISQATGGTPQGTPQKKKETVFVEDLISFGSMANLFDTPKKEGTASLIDEKEEALLKEVAATTGIAELMIAEENASAQQAREEKLDPVLQPENPFAAAGPSDPFGSAEAPQTTIALDFFGSSRNLFDAPNSAPAAAASIKDPAPQADDFNPFA